MTRTAWTAGVIACGVVAVGVITGCVLVAIPDRPAAQDWPLYVPLLAAPYLACAAACWRAHRIRFVRVASLVSCGAGVLVAAVAVADAWPAVAGGEAPAMPASALAAVPLLMAQYTACLVAGVVGFAGPRS